MRRRKYWSEIPSAEEDEVFVKVHAIGICSTDVHIIKKYRKM
ncbi:hypothetical protein DTX80_03565 [Bacilli bacterium]|nr:hypothetical protein DEJ64_04725 [Bacilli bacterium]PZD90240.1 hypothetical protein DEJ60_03790 [Bacilli bacterium]PZD92134.1 hypothetical protein DEJ66_04245 [Bacilli bacterium]RCO07024.1 hypothetical protein DTX80_03565 [Bacilli bacterium]RCO08205.1 hypothetical protein DTX79_16750 [Bacilli bacterium]